MSKIKRCLAVLVCAAMALATMPGVALAEGGVTADGLEYEVYDGYVEITGYSGEASELEIPAEINGVPVMRIADGQTGGKENEIVFGVFTRNDKLISVTLPDSLTHIGENAFYGCENLKTINFPDGIAEIGQSAFYGCKNLVEVTIPDSVAEIGFCAFGDCTSLSAIYVDANNLNYTGHDGVLFDKAMTEIIQYPCGSIHAEYVIPDKVTRIGDYAFADCIGLTNIIISDSVTSIGDSAFCYCIGLTSITISESVTIIGDKAFERCTSLTNVTIPDSVTTIGYEAFLFCENLTNVTISNSVTVIDGAFYNCKSLSSVIIPDSVTKIGWETFSRCVGLTSIFIPASVTEIGGAAFDECSALTNVYYGGTKTEWDEVKIGFYNDPLLTTTIHYNTPMPETTPTAPEIKVTVNGAPIDFDVPPTAIDGTTMLPVRYALEPLGAEFVWDGENQTVTITAKGKTIVLTIGSATALVDGVEKTMAQPAMANNGRTLIPIRFVSEELGYDVQWDGETNTVIING